jgi:hypothetical protein
MDGEKIGAGWTMLLTAIPAWARAQSEHERSALSELLRWKCATATKLVRKTSKTHSSAPPRYANPECRNLALCGSRPVVPSRNPSFGFMSSEMLAEFY